MSDGIRQRSRADDAGIVAQNAGAVSVCVLSGESSMDDLNAAERKPDYVLKNVAELAQILKAN